MTIVEFHSKASEFQWIFESTFLKDFLISCNTFCQKLVFLDFGANTRFEINFISLKFVFQVFVNDIVDFIRF